ncbi:mucin-5AC [Aplysia californica]|uniref:Mucin-5AC n=1 Tax=Aplysia californica TaxID=6500 RepID=A0ABM1A3D7_APLCA|nr:mucin-5AC [Aplysia californica]
MKTPNIKKRCRDGKGLNRSKLLLGLSSESSFPLFSILVASLLTESPKKKQKGASKKASAALKSSPPSANKISVGATNSKDISPPISVTSPVISNAFPKVQPANPGTLPAMKKESSSLAELNATVGATDTSSSPSLNLSTTSNSSPLTSGANSVNRSVTHAMPAQPAKQALTVATPKPAPRPSIPMTSTPVPAAVDRPFVSTPGLDSTPVASLPGRRPSKEGMPVSLPEQQPPQQQQQQQQQQNGEGDTSSDQPRRSSSEKENICEMASKQSPGSKSPGKSSKSKTKSKKSEKQQQYAQGVEEEMSQSQQSPVLMEQRELEPLTPLVINENQDISMDQHRPQATSTPAANGQFRSPPLSPDSGTDQSDDEAFSPSDHQLHSPSMSLNSTSTGTGSLRFSRTQSDSIDSRRSEPNFGRFYNTSYLGMGKPGDSYLKRGGATASPQSSRPKPAGGSHFHRPPNFTYSKDPPDFLKKKASGMSALATTKRVVKVRRSSSPADLRTQEPIRMSMFPSAKPKLANELDKIERDDWPGPASPAALLPEILRQRRRSKGEKDDDNDEDEVVENPKIKRELEEISKIKDESGIGRVIYKELEEQKAKPRQPLDPWKASRAPSAKFEPRYRTRFQSPMFASPSRFLDRPRYAWDDSDIRTYRSVSTLANLPTPKPGYGPSYMTPRAATLPLAGAYGARVDFRYFDFGEDDDRPEPSTHTSSSTLTGDTSSRRHDSSYYEGPSISLLKLQKNTWHTEAEPTIYPYEQLKITNFDLPKDVDTNKLEIHLAHDDFEKLFNMPKESFYRMAEWKRNDIKRKLHLY